MNKRYPSAKAIEFTDYHSQIDGEWYAKQAKNSIQDVIDRGQLDISVDIRVATLIYINPLYQKIQDLDIDNDEHSLIKIQNFLYLHKCFFLSKTYIFNGPHLQNWRCFYDALHKLSQFDPRKISRINDCSQEEKRVIIVELEEIVDNIKFIYDHFHHLNMLNWKVISANKITSDQAGPTTGQPGSTTDQPGPSNRGTSGMMPRKSIGDNKKGPDDTDDSDGKGGEKIASGGCKPFSETHRQRPNDDDNEPGAGPSGEGELSPMQLRLMQHWDQANKYLNKSYSTGYGKQHTLGVKSYPLHE